MRILAGATTALRRIVDLVLVGLIMVVLFAVILGKGAPLVGRQSIVIGGASMEPALGLGSAIVIRPVDAATLAVGDVVSLQVGPERTTFTHRIIDVVDRPDGRWIRTQGDANPTPDPTLVPASAVIGRVEFVIPFAGYLLALLSLPMGVMFVLGLAATLLAIAWLLESLEPDPRPVRRLVPDAPDAAAPAAGPAPGPGSVTARDPALARGEPIAARRLPSGPSDGGPIWSSAARRTPAAMIGGGDVALAVGHANAARDSVARPTVREQLARSRENRNRRARWHLGRDGNRHASH
jgi:signal peptidase